MTQRSPGKRGRGKWGCSKGAWGALARTRHASLPSSHLPVNRGAEAGTRKRGHGAVEKAPQPKAWRELREDEPTSRVKGKAARPVEQRSRNRAIDGAGRRGTSKRRDSARRDDDRAEARVEQIRHVKHRTIHGECEPRRLPKRRRRAVRKRRARPARERRYSAVGRQRRRRHRGCGGRQH